MASAADIIDFEVFKSALFSIADEMAITICRTTYSGVLRDNMDFSTAIADASGQLVAQGLTLPVHLGSIRTALSAVLAKYGSDIAEGDVFVLNDPFEGGMHLPDIFVFMPVFVDGVHVAFAATTAHHCDVGGHVPGSNAANSTEIFQEGLRIPPLKLVRKGVNDESLWTLLRANVRLPVQLQGDIRAQLAACEMARRQIDALARRFGLDRCRTFMVRVIEYTEKLARAAIRELPDGEFEFEDWIDDDGVDAGKSIRLFVTVRKARDSIEFDWTGSSKQVRGAINSTLSVTEAASYTALRAILPGQIPNTEGVFKAINVIAPKGSIANVEMPGACAARALTAFRMLDCAFGALAQMVPDRVFAASDGGNVGVTIAGMKDCRERFVYVDFACGTWGGRPWADGLQGVSNIFVNMASQSVEVIEAEHPIQLLAYEFETDACGAGLYRGGAPFSRHYRVNAPDAIVQIRSDRQAHRPYGLYGGQAGKPASVHVRESSGEFRQLASKAVLTFSEDGEFRYVLAGGGGWGDPLQRSPENVLRDVRNEYVSAEAARREYGVVVDTRKWRVDADGTRALREKLTAARCGKPVPFVNWGDTW
ncbi:MAG: hydantoinase B/oxoprolinase family protein [Parvibaculaceae bacterium]